MGRGRTTFFDAIAALPWPVGLGAGVGACGYLAVAHGIPLLFSRADTLGTVLVEASLFVGLTRALFVLKFNQ